MRRLFDRPAFSMPCIFEYSLEEVNDACNQITLALQTGRVYRQREQRELLYNVPGANEFETEPFVSTVRQIRNLVSNLRRSVDLLREHFRHLQGMKPGQSGQHPDQIWHMEFYLLDLIESGVSKDSVRRAFAIMDKIDSERNAIIELINALFELGSLTQLPKITLSTEQLSLSEQMQGASWNKYYLRAQAELKDFLGNNTNGGKGT